MLFCGAYEKLPYRLCGSLVCKHKCTRLLTYLLVRSESNVTLGLGLNRVLVLVVDSSTAGGSDDERRVLNVYTLTVYRQPRVTPSSSPTHSRPHSAATAPSPHACRLLQVGNEVKVTCGFTSVPQTAFWY